jgi:RimJ/RimL family protein N-acetyltransferase
MTQKYSLVNIKSKHIDDINRITSQPGTMGNVGLGKIWDNKKVNSFIKYNKIEQKESHITRTNFYWAMQIILPPINIIQKLIVGIVGIHKVQYVKPKYQNRFYVTIFIDNNHIGKGYGTTFLKGALNKFSKLKPNTPVYADIGVKNIGSQKLHAKLGFVPIGKVHTISKSRTKYQTYIYQNMDV